MRPLARKAAEMLQQQGGKAINFNLIESTLRQIGGEYRSGLIRWIRDQPERWTQLLQLEDGINQAALAKDEEGLKDALSEYRTFFEEMLKFYSRDYDLPLFEGRANG